MTDYLREALDLWDDWEERVKKRDPEFLGYLEVEMLGGLYFGKGAHGRQRRKRIKEAREIIDGLCRDVEAGREPFGGAKTL